LSRAVRPRIILRVAGAMLLFCATAGLARGAAPSAPPGVDPAGVAEQLRRIQTICFAAYPPVLLERMSKRPGPPPTEVALDPRLQIKYLKTEDVVKKGLFYPSLLEELAPAFIAAVKPGDRFLDLGSGDGRVVFLAALLGAEATGIEFDRELHGIALTARSRLRDLIDPAQAALRRGDFFREDLSRYDVIFYYGSGSFGEERMARKLETEMHDGAVVLASYTKADLLANLNLEGEYGPVRILRKGARP